ncbi:MAG TPA: anhydro-N-acetylmuramic acid kinase, partial [Chitinophagaceae bacterium]|nr:anhydro-N-acetylmuramic acid kinase [Chitinophagaceae bacterium]
MNKQIEKLYQLAAKPSRLIIGLMSGTSVDGLDIALCRVEGSGAGTRLSLLQFETIPFSTSLQAEVRSVFSKKNVDLEKLTLLHKWIALQHAGLVNEVLKKWQVDPR